MFELILIRHGETEFNRAGRFQGGHDSPLTEKGEDEARKLGEAMQKFGGQVHAWYISPQGRTRQTSALIREQLQMPLPDEIPHEQIVEIRCGEWESQLRDELPQDELRRIHSSTDIPYPGGESLRDVSKRCELFLEDWKRALPAEHGGPHRTVVVSHGNLVRCMGGVLSGIGPDFALRALKHNTGVSRFFTRERDFFFRLLTWNDTSHLAGGNPFFEV